MCCAVGAGATYEASDTSAPTSRNATTFTPRTGDVAPETSSEMIPNSCSARCGADGTSALLSGVRPLHSLQQLEPKRTLACELLEQGALARNRTPRALPSKLTPCASSDLHLLLPREHGLLFGLGGRFRPRFRPVLNLNLHEPCLTHHV